MKVTALLAGALPALALAFTKEEYDSGEVHMSIMARKESTWENLRKQGRFNSRKWNPWSKWDQTHGRRGMVKCVNGVAEVEVGNPNETFKCNNMDFYDFKSHADLGSALGEGSNTWGWVSKDGREFAALGQADGTAFVEITKNGKLSYVGRLPQQSVPSIWREMKGYNDYMLIGSEAVGHGVQIFDMNKLLDLDPRYPKNFSTTADLTGLFTDLPAGRSHNVVVNQELGYGVAVGAAPRNTSCAGGLIYINLDDITKPFSPGCAGQDGYVHDAQCIVYRGPDTRYTGRDICYGYNEDTLTIYDATNKVGQNTSSIISRTTYVGASYTHQGWLTNPNWQEFLIMNDELDESDGVGPASDGVPVTFIWDVRDLEKPVQSGFFKHRVTGIDHNLYINEGLATLSNYGAGVSVLDVSGLAEDPTGGNVEEIGYFDIYPEDDNAPGGGEIEFVGTWGHYAFPSGYVIINTIERGGFVVKHNKFKRRGVGKWWKK